jgi:putative tricarboxylic transport membrane protein
LLVNVSLIGLLGFVVASTLLFACVARAFGSSRPGRDIAVGFAIAALTYYGFAGLLGINIGAGVFRDMF